MSPSSTKRAWPLRYKFAVAAIGISLIPLAVVAWLNVGEARDQAFTEQTALLHARVDQLVDNLDQFNRAYARASSRLAHTPEVVAFVAAPAPDATLTTRLQLAVDGDPAVRGIAVLDRSGQVVAATEPELVGHARGFRTYTQAALAGTPTISDPYIAEEGVPTIAYATPIVAPDGKVAGAVAFWIRASALWDVARRANGLAGERSYAVIYDHAGIRIAHTGNATMVFHPAAPLPAAVRDRLVAENRFGDATAGLVADVRAMPQQAMRATSDAVDEATLVHGYAPGNQLHNYGVARRFETTQWTVFFMVPDDTLFAPIHELTRKLAIAAVVIGGLALVVALLFARANIDPLEALVAQRTAAFVASEAKYRQLYETSSDMHLTVAMPEQLIVDCNKTLCDRLGYAKDELVGRHYAMIYHPEYLDELPHLRARFATAGEYVDVERQLRCKDGSTIESSLSLRVAEDDSGRTVARATWRDISRRKQADRDRSLLVQLGEVLHESPTSVAESLAGLCRIVGTHFAVPRCMLVHVDEATGRVDRVLAEHHRGTIALLDAADRTPLLAHLYEAAATRRPIAIDDVIVAIPLGGSTVFAIAAPRAWDARELTLVTLAAERAWTWLENQRMTAALRESAVREAVAASEARFGAIVEQVHDHAIYMLDAGGRVTTWNPGAARLKGYRDTEVIGQSFARFFTAEDRACDHHLAVLDRAARDGHYEEEGWRVRKDGSRFWANVVVTAMRGRDGALEGFAKVMRDFTERRDQEDRLRASLREREVLLQEVHHRVKNNLQVISSMIAMQARRLVEGDARAALETCRKRVLSIALIHEKLYQAGDYAEVRFADYCTSLVAHVHEATGIGTRGIAIELAIDDVTLPIDRAIPCGLLLNELITNSVKHGFPEGRTGRIRVELHAEDDRLRLSVNDDGVGLPLAFDLARSKSMGLQLVTTLARQLRADVASDNRGGARFQVSFARSAA